MINKGKNLLSLGNVVNNNNIIKALLRSQNYLKYVFGLRNVHVLSC